MFERLFQQVLSKFLSKYFTEDSLAANKINRSTQLGVWSGYVSLQNLVLKKDVINAKLKSKGQPFEIVHCSFRQVEISIPWAKLSNPIGSHGRMGKDDAVVVVVVDGIHLLGRTNFDFDDVALRREEVKKRRRALADPFRKIDEQGSMSYREMLKQRLKDGFVQEIASKIHVHLRDVHIRLEDIESDPSNPYSCGLTLESMHIQHDDSDDIGDGVVAKMAQLNHLAIYWNALGYQDDIPAENGVLHVRYQGETNKFAELLDSCIARRASLVSSPSKNAHMPTHTYLLMPVDGTWHGRFSTNPKDLSMTPAAEMTISIDPVYGQLRDYQCIQILSLVSEFKNHKYVKRYRQFRPLTSVMEDPKAWWMYATRAIRFQLREKFLRSSWVHFVDVLSTRNSYMGLYERNLKFPRTHELERIGSELDGAILERSRHSAVASDSLLSIQPGASDSHHTTTPDDGAGPSIRAAISQPESALTSEEQSDLKDMEDGLLGGLSVETILLCRALVHSRQGRKSESSKLRDTTFLSAAVESDFVQDSDDAKAELHTLLEYLNTTFDVESGADKGNPAFVAVSIVVRFQELNLSLLSPLAATVGEHPLRQIHDTFFELSMRDMRCGFLLKGDYDAKEYSLSMQDLVGTELRGDRSHHVVIQQLRNGQEGDESYSSADAPVSNADPLVSMSYAQSAKRSTGIDVDLFGDVRAVEVTIVPECEWIIKCKAAKDKITRMPNVAEYWKNLSFAYMNSLALGRLGLVAKIESASTDHKNIQADIKINCPVLRIGDGRSGSLLVDLGVADFKTVRLAARPSNEITTKIDATVKSSGDAAMPLVADGLPVSVIGSFNSLSWGTKHQMEAPSISRRKQSQRSTTSSTHSVDSRTQGGFGTRSVAGSTFFDDPLARVNEEGVDDEDILERQTMSLLFYDVFFLCINTGKITLCGDSDAFEICCGFEIQTTIKKSVLPADHTLCKIHAQTVVDDLCFNVSEKVISVGMEAVGAWKALLASNRELRGSAKQTSSREMAPGSLKQKHMPFTAVVDRASGPAVRLDTSSIVGEEDLASQIDESEFFDTHENDGSFDGDNSVVWFGENWISDAESFIDSDSQSGRPDRRSRRRRAGSVSDVSSVSDQSAKEASTRESKPQNTNGYLSAENLARLEEGASEDESLVENLMDMDDATFHSVMSEKGQLLVLHDLEENIHDSNTMIDDLNFQLRQLSNESREPSAETEDPVRAQRRSLKLRLGRARAELRGLQALYVDLRAVLSRESTPGEENIDSEVESRRAAQAKNTKTILAARRRRNLMMETNGRHNLTMGINRELFQGSLLFHHCRFTVILPEDSTDDASKGRHKTPVLELVANQTGLAIFHLAHDTKLYLTSDQVLVSFQDKGSQSARAITLFSGGNGDTFLPSHFPHLVSRSIEDKFVRCSLHLDRRDSRDKRAKESRFLKARFVMGDVEISPATQVVGPLRSLFGLVGRRAPEDAPVHGTDLQEATDDVLDVSLENHRSSKKKSHFLERSSISGLDIAARISSLRVLTNVNGRLSGAAIATEAAIRVLLVGQRIQVDTRCTNLQLLHITSPDAGHGYEILGRRDPYNPLIQIRARSHLTTSGYQSSWVIGENNPQTEELDGGTRPVRSVHLGVKISPLSVVALPQSLLDFRHNIDGLSKFRKGKVSKAKPFRDKSKFMLLVLTYPLRWRADISLKRAVFHFPAKSSEALASSDEIESRLKLSFAFVCSLQESQQDSVSIRGGITEVSIVRPSDEWNVLEPVSILCDLNFETPGWLVGTRKSHAFSPGPLKLGPHSPFDEVSSLMRRYEWDPLSLQHDATAQHSCIFRLTMIKINVSAPTIAAIVDAATNLKGALSKRGPSQVTAPSMKIPSHLNGKKLEIGAVLDSIEVEVLREMDAKPISHSASLISFTMTDIRLDFEHGEQIAASVLIRNSALYDLSSSRAVQVVGENSGRQEKDSPYFVRAELYVDTNIDGPTTARLDISWGRIQCLVLPAFLASILSLKDDIQSILSQSSVNKGESKKNGVVEKLEQCDRDINFILTAHADAFECILSSKDISEYVRHNESEAIGAVALRWKASLSLALALDTLCGTSFPWLTLNLDGRFADGEDARIFKDFIGRYVSFDTTPTNPPGAMDHIIQNVFTARLGLAVSDFQVLRTTIAGHAIKAAPKTKSYKSSTRVCFVVAPPSIGEQRVTNPIGLDISYRVAGSTVASLNSDGQGKGALRMEASQLLEVRAKFVDILLYISPSTGGITESFRTTVRPILDIIKDVESRRRSSTPKRFERNQVKAKNKKRSLIDVLKSAPTMSLIKFEGFQVTCVPGGATRLNESPILKIELNHFSSGLACVPLPIQRRGLGSRSSNNLLLSTDSLHTYIAGWISCDLSGHYHNRRLVAWEPFVEPWTADLKYGVDIVDALDLSPISSPGDAYISSTIFPDSGRIENQSSSSLHDIRGDRLRDFGRLFRAPFQSSLTARQTSADETKITQLDFCYLMLVSMSRTTMLDLMHSSIETKEERERWIFSRLPTREKFDWLLGFGFPGRENAEVYASSLILCDSKPLNINVTGALLENLLVYLHKLESKSSQRIAPHWIRNDTGMTIRIQEVLDSDRLGLGEEAGKVVVVDGAEVPLTLQRSLSQTCDPHRAYIHLEVGSFEDTVGRIRHEDFSIAKGTLSSSFFFKATAKIPVDTVGFHRYPLDRNNESRNEGKAASSDSRALGWVIVRVALQGGVKVVSVESPLVLKSTADISLVCEVRGFDGLSLLWRCLIPNSCRKDEKTGSHGDALVSIPADIVPLLNDESYSFTVFALPRDQKVCPDMDLTPSISQSKAIAVKAPPPFSPESFSKGLIGTKEVNISTLDTQTGKEISEGVNLTVCSFRIGSFSGVRGGVEIPEQRMVLFRAPVAIRNCLALPVAVQVRVKSQNVTERQQQGQVLTRLTTSLPEWEDLGILECGESVNWTGARATEKVQLRVRFVGTDGDNSRKFPDWSSVVAIPSIQDASSILSSRHLGSTAMKSFAKMRVLDVEGTALSLSLGFDSDNVGRENESSENLRDIRRMSEHLSGGSRAVSIFVPYWIVDSTSQDLEFFSGMAIAGQLGKDLHSEYQPTPGVEDRHCLGLAELLDNENFLNLSSSRSFEVFMLGDQSSTRLMVRKRLARQRRDAMRRLAPPWSDPIPLHAEGQTIHDITVLDPRIDEERLSEAEDFQNFDRLILRSRILAAPSRFGGQLGAKLVHVVNRYSILNETGRDVEIASEYELSSPVVVRGTGVSQPFHFDENSPMRLRFKEFGWSWSGKFNVRRNKTELTMRLRHKMKGLTVIITVELAEKKGGTSLLVLRQSNYPPFRLENHTMFPLLFGQSAVRMSSEENEADAMLLPYQRVNFAWDEPELRRRILVVKMTDNPNLPHNFVLGRFQLDKIAPGTLLSIDSNFFSGEIVADGPTRVLRIADSSMPSLSSTRQDGLTDFHHRPGERKSITAMFSAKLMHGIGISLVDWSPQELLYVRLEDIHLERKFDGNSDVVSLSAGSMKLNNQLWVTPYPVLLKMGRRVDPLHPIRRKNRRHDAIAVSWKRLTDTHGSLGNVTLLEQVEISMEPIYVNVDGQLADLIVKMLYNISSIRLGEQQSGTESMTRDDVLRSTLNLPGPPSEEAETARRGFTPYQQSSDGDLMTTAAVASKLKSHPLPYVSIHPNSHRSPRSLSSRRAPMPPDAPKPQHKYYIEKLRISAAKVDLSWSGPLPGLLSSLLLRALTFESLPVRLRPYSSLHVYGNAKDHLQHIKAHYLSVWRMFDLFMGLSSNPTFLFRAIVYTTRETFASVLEHWAFDWRKSAKKITKFLRKVENTHRVISDDITTGGTEFSTSSLLLGRRALSPFAQGAITVLGTSSSAMTAMASILKVGLQNTKRLAAKGLVRSRNPRLFAHMEGRDLLVEYVEGENAGKALLSRVRMGIHLGEGYIFHSEGVRLLKVRAKSKTDLDSAPLIAMLTSERAMLLNGKLDWDFCSIVWEAALTSIVHLEFIAGDAMSVTRSHDEVVIWYLVATEPIENSTVEDRAAITTAHARAVAAGVGVLHRTSIFLPNGTGKQLVAKLTSMEGRLGEHVEVTDEKA